MVSESRDYKGHRIELVGVDREVRRARAADERADETELRVDGVPVGYGQLPSGRYFLDEYAYDWRDSLMDVATGWIDYRERVDQLRRDAGA